MISARFLEQNGLKTIIAIMSRESKSLKNVSLLGRRLEGKGKIVLGVRETRFSRAKNSLSLPF